MTAPRSDVFATETPPEPAGAETHWLTGTGGVRLFASARLPPTAPPVGIVFIVGGGEVRTAEPYPGFVSALHRAGFGTATVHPRGSGYSGGTRGDVTDYALVVGDLAQGAGWARGLVPASTPLFLFGHSVGGALALELAARWMRPSGVVLVNPAFRLRRSPGMGPSWSDYARYAWYAVFRRAAPVVDMNRSPSLVVDPDDRAEAEAMQRDPLVVRRFSLRYMLGQRRVMARSASNARHTDTPILLVQGTRDSLVDPAGHDEILTAAPNPDRERLVATGGAHGASAVETAADDIVTWLLRHR